MSRDTNDHQHSKPIDRLLAAGDQALLRHWFPSPRFDLEELNATYGSARLALWVLFAGAVADEMDLEFDEDDETFEWEATSRGDLVNRLLTAMNTEPIDWGDEGFPEWGGI